jgi:hypothetical protein
MHGALALFVELSLRYPHFLESVEGSEDRSAHPGGVESFLGSSDLKESVRI